MTFYFPFSCRTESNRNHVSLKQKYSADGYWRSNRLCREQRNGKSAIDYLLIWMYEFYYLHAQRKYARLPTQIGYWISERILCVASKSDWNSVLIFSFQPLFVMCAYAAFNGASMLIGVPPSQSSTTLHLFACWFALCTRTTNKFFCLFCDNYFFQAIHSPNYVAMA